MKAAEIGIEITGESKDFDKAAGDAEKRLKKTEKAFNESLAKISGFMTGVGLTMTAAVTIPLAAAALKATEAASDLKETVSKTEQVFGKATKTVKNFGKESASAFGMSRKAALDFSSSFGLILQGAGETEAKSADMSVALAKLSADLASFYNVDVEDAAQKLKSGLVGEAEPLRAFGIMLSENAVKSKAMAMGFKEVAGQLTEAQKVQARYQIILDQTAKSQGDFARTSDGLANQTRITKALFADLAADLGETLLPYAQQFVKWVREMLQAFRDLSPEQKEMAVRIAMIAAAIGPLLIVGGQMIAFFLKAKEVWAVLSVAFAQGGAAITAIQTAISVLSGPIGWLIAAAVALYVAWKKNLFGIRDMVEPVVKQIRGWFKDTVENIVETVGILRDAIVGWWAEIEPTVRPYIEAFTGLVRGELARMVKGVQDGFRFMYDVINVVMGLIQIASGKGWNDLTDSIKASVMRMRAIVYGGMVNVAKAVIEAFKKIFGFLSSIPGIGDMYDGVVAKADEFLASLTKQAIMAEVMARSYQSAADKARSLKDAQEALARAGSISGGSDGGNNAGGGGNQGSGATKASAKQLTADLIIAMGNSIKSPGSKADPACAYFASTLISKFTDGITDSGGKIQWSAGELVKRLRDQIGAELVASSEALPGSLAFRKGSGPSGVHVGVGLGDGRVMDMNGQRDGLRNTKDIIDAQRAMKEGWQFLNIPAEFLSKAFTLGKVPGTFAEMSKQSEALIGKIADLRRESMMLGVTSAVAAAQIELQTTELGKADEATKAFYLSEVAKAEALAKSQAGHEAFKDVLHSVYKETQLGAAADEVARIAIERKWAGLQELTKAESDLLAAAITRREEEAKFREEVAKNSQAATSLKDRLRDLLLENQLLGVRSEMEKDLIRFRASDDARRQPFLAALVQIQLKLNAAKKQELDLIAESDKAYQKFWQGVWTNIMKAVDAAKKLGEAQDQRFGDYVKDLNIEYLKLVGLTKEARIEQLMLNNQLRQDQAQRLVDLQDRIAILREAEDQAREISQSIADSIGGIFENMVKNADFSFSSIVESFRQMLYQIALDYLKNQIFKSIFNFALGFLGPKGGTGGFDLIDGKSMFGGFLADGGPAKKGYSYVVGDGGEPEVFTPGVSGTVTPMSKLGGGTTNVTINMTVNASDADSFKKSEAQIVQRLGEGISRATRRNGG